MPSGSTSQVSSSSKSPKSLTPQFTPPLNVPSPELQEVQQSLPPKQVVEGLPSYAEKQSARLPDRPPNTLRYVVDDRLKCPLCRSTSIRQARASADLCLAILLSAFCFPCGILSFLWVSKVRYCEVCGAEF
uniref:Membrane protein BRI3 n=1 Tax=Parascaris univalens TaxID=6257 RepID=A0A915B9R6_PARUN